MTLGKITKFRSRLLMLAACLGVAAAAISTLNITASAEVKSVLDKDDAVVSRLWLGGIVDGTGPFDGNNDPGNDAIDNNRIVRSFDSVTYDLQYAHSVKTPGVTYREGYVRFEFTLPYTEDIATFDTAAMGWMSTANGYKWAIKKNPDGTQTLTAWHSDPDCCQTAGGSSWPAIGNPWLWQC